MEHLLLLLVSVSALFSLLAVLVDFCHFSSQLEVQHEKLLTTSQSATPTHTRTAWQQIMTLYPHPTLEQDLSVAATAIPTTSPTATSTLPTVWPRALFFPAVLSLTATLTEGKDILVQYTHGRHVVEC